MAGPTDNVAAPQEGAGANQDPQAPQSDNLGGKKILGKYATVEEAERGYRELERFAYEQSRRASEATRQIEQLASQGAASNVDRFGYASNNQGFINPQQEAEYNHFVTQPLDYLKRRDEAVERRALDRARAEFRTELNARDILSQWKSDNPDLVRHEPLIGTFVAQQPAHLSIREKLDRAGEEARRYLANEIARTSQNRQNSPNPNSVVEAPSGSAPNFSQASFQEPPASEDALAEYIKERNSWSDKRKTVR